MDRSRVCNLITTSYSVDAIGQQVPVETVRQVYCNIRSVSRSEWQSGGVLGLKPELQITMFTHDYEGEEIVEVEGVRYGIYRTYLTENESLELYLERKVGRQ